MAEDTSQLEERLSELERKLRRTQGVLLFFACAVVGAAAVAVLGDGPSLPVILILVASLALAGLEVARNGMRSRQRTLPRVRTRKLEIVDERGNVLLELGESVDGSARVRNHVRGAPFAATLAKPAEPPASNPAHIELIYRGDGVYEAVYRIATTGGAGQGAEQRRRWTVAPTQQDHSPVDLRDPRNAK